MRISTTTGPAQAMQLHEFLLTHVSPPQDDGRFEVRQSPTPPDQLGPADVWIEVVASASQLIAIVIAIAAWLRPRVTQIPPPEPPIQVTILIDRITFVMETG